MLEASSKIIGTYHILINTHNPDILVLTETKLTKSHKPRTWMEHLLEGFKWWSAYDRWFKWWSAYDRWFKWWSAHDR